MDPVKLPPGYLLPDDMTMKDVLRIDAELLASEGIDPEWPSFDEETERQRRGLTGPHGESGLELGPTAQLVRSWPLPDDAEPGGCLQRQADVPSAVLR
jgi:hypothetical protein